MSALNATKRDLAEFVTVLGTDTKKAVSGASANIKGILQQVCENVSLVSVLASLSPITGLSVNWVSVR